MNKKILTALLCVVATVTAQAQYQLTNGDFESWETVEYSGKSCEEPVRWSSFYDATGDYKSTAFMFASAAQVFKDENVRPESTGQYSCRITSQSVFGVVAQGNLTTGCVNMGAMSATEASGNYNYINEAREDQAMRFTGRPDAVRFWVRFSGVKNGNCSVLLTTKGYYQDPVFQDRNTATLVGQALSGDRIVSNDEWTQYTVPFEWLSDEQPYYALVNVSTCAEPGAGAAADYLYIDDMEMIYNSEATAINYGGENILGSELISEDFDPAKMGKVETNGRGTKTSWKFESSTNKLTVTVEGDNISQDPANVHVYQIAFTGGEDAESGDDGGGDDPVVVGPQPVELVKGSTYYVFNKASGLFLQDNNKLSNEAVTEWIIGGDNTIRTADGKSVNVKIEGDDGWFGSDKPKSVTVKTDASEATTLNIAGDVKGYSLSASASWKYGFLNANTANYTAYMTGNGTELTYADNGAADAGKWQLYDANEYKLYYARKALEEEMLRAEQIGMDVTAVRQVLETSESADELQTVLDQLRLDEAQYVSDKYTEDRTMLLGTTDLTDNSKWTTNLVANKGKQHWSGDEDRVYYEQTGDQWGQTSWAVSAEQTVELPAGQYLLKAAGRSSVFAQAKMTVDGVEVAFPAKDDYGYGIDIEGNVNFSSNGVYCNNGLGRGWEYRYLAIDVKQRGNVTVKFEASTENNIYQWFSVCDIELLAVPTPVLKMVSFDYDGVSYTPDEENKIDLSDIYYDETKECDVITKGYGVVTTSFNSETAVYTITLSQEEGYDYELEPVIYQVQFHEIPAPLAFTESLTIDINGMTIPGGEITVYLAENPDGTYDFELPNFILNMGADVPIGTIRLTNIEMNEREGVLCFTKEQSVQIAPGTDERFTPDQWMGPQLGELPIVLDEGYVYNGRIYVHLSIDMMQTLGQMINVTVGDKANIPESVTGIGTVSAKAADSLSDGKYLIGGRVVVVKNGKRFTLSGRRL